MAESKEYFWVGRLATVLCYCFGVFWIFALVTDLQNLFDTTAEVYKDGKGQLFGYTLAKIVIPPLFIFSPYIICFIAQYISGLDFEQPSEDADWVKEIDSFWLGASIVLGVPIVIYNIIFRNFLDVPRDFGYLHIVCFLHFLFSVLPLLMLAANKDRPNSSH